MGVSFYAVIEYKQFDNYFSFAEVDIPQNDKLILAVVFGSNNETNEKLFPTRGIPPDCSLKVGNLFFTVVETVQDYLTEFKDDNEEEISIDEYVKASGDWAVKQYKANKLLPLPELYESSWLSFSELQESLTHEKISISELSASFRAALVAMESLSLDFGAENVRLVFWCGM